MNSNRLYLIIIKTHENKTTNIIFDISLLKWPQTLISTIFYSKIKTQNKSHRLHVSLSLSLVQSRPITLSKQWTPLRVKYRKRSKVRRRGFCGGFSMEPNRCFTKLPKALKIEDNFYSVNSFFAVLHV